MKRSLVVKHKHIFIFLIGLFEKLWKYKTNFTFIVKRFVFVKDLEFKWVIEVETKNFSYFSLRALTHSRTHVDTHTHTHTPKKNEDIE